MKIYEKPIIEYSSLFADCSIAAGDILIENTSSLWNDSRFLGTDEETPEYE